MSNLVPVVVEKTSAGERSYDLFSRLLKDRIVMLNGEVNHHTAQLIVGQLLFLEADAPGLDISLFINSPGGSVVDGLAIYDTMQFVKCDVSTYVLGQSCSMGSLLASSGTHGKRYILPHARHMLHQVSSGSSGVLQDMEIQLRETVRLNQRILDIYAKHTKNGVTKLKQDMNRDFFMNATQAVSYGLADKVIESRDEIE